MQDSDKKNRVEEANVPVSETFLFRTVDRGVKHRGEGSSIV